MSEISTTRCAACHRKGLLDDLDAEKGLLDELDAEEKDYSMSLMPKKRTTR